MLFAAFAVLASLRHGKYDTGKFYCGGTFGDVSGKTDSHGNCVKSAYDSGDSGRDRNHCVKVTEYLVPCMAVFYLFGTGMVIFTHFKNLPAGVVQILWGSFLPGGYDRRGGRDDACSGKQESPIPEEWRCAMGSPEVFSQMKRDWGRRESVLLPQIRQMRCIRDISA